MKKENWIMIGVAALVLIVILFAKDEWDKGAETRAFENAVEQIFE